MGTTDTQFLGKRRRVRRDSRGTVVEDVALCGLPFDGDGRYRSEGARQGALVVRGKKMLNLQRQELGTPP